MYTELAQRRQHFHVSPAEEQPNIAVNTSWIFKNALCKDTVTHSESHTTRTETQWLFIVIVIVIAIVAIVKYLGVILIRVPQQINVHNY